ncbi:MAG: Flp family type IVb pilin [Desulfobulbus sp.]|jgi:pilus assembly protein Flp/PilA
MYSRLRSLWQDESGATAIEYGLIAGVMAAILVTVLGLFGDNLKELFQAINDKLADSVDKLKSENPNP